MICTNDRETEEGGRRPIGKGSENIDNDQRRRTAHQSERRFWTWPSKQRPPNGHEAEEDEQDEEAEEDRQSELNRAGTGRKVKQKKKELRCDAASIVFDLIASETSSCGRAAESAKKNEKDGEREREKCVISWRFDDLKWDEKRKLRKVNRAGQCDEMGEKEN